MISEDNLVMKKIEQLYTQKGWSLYRLAKESNIPYSSLNNMMQRNTQPTVYTLEKLCDGLGMTMSEFFDDRTPITDYMYYLRLQPDEFILVETYRTLPPKKQERMLAYLDGLSEKV